MSTLSEEPHSAFDNSSTDQWKPLNFGVLVQNLIYFNVMVKNIRLSMNRGTVIPLFLDGTHVGHSVESVDIILTL